MEQAAHAADEERNQATLGAHRSVEVGAGGVPDSGPSHEAVADKACRGEGRLG